jgi:hypothetical protein
VEEVSFRGEHHEPAIQLLELDDGTQIVRFCSYTLKGTFERNSWLAGETELRALGQALAQAPRLAAFLRPLWRPAKERDDGDKP